MDAARRRRRQRPEPVRHQHLRRPGGRQPCVDLVLRVTARTRRRSPGHVFQVVYNPGTGTSTWTDRSFNFGDLPVTDLVRDDPTGDLYAATDFGVLRLAAGTTTLDDRRAGHAERRGGKPRDRRGQADPLRRDPRPEHLEAQPRLTPAIRPLRPEGRRKRRPSDVRSPASEADITRGRQDLLFVDGLRRVRRACQGRDIAFCSACPRSFGGALSTATERSGRSINAEIVSRLEESLEQDQPDRVACIDHVGTGDRDAQGTYSPSARRRSASSCSHWRPLPPAG